MSRYFFRATRSDTGSHNRLDLIQSLVPPHYVCNGYVSEERYSLLIILSIKMNFQQICTILSGRLHFVHDVTLFFPFFHQCQLLCFVSHSNEMTSCQSSLAENVSCNVAPYHHTMYVMGMYLATSIKVEWEYVSFMMISCIFCYRRYCMMWRHLALPPLWVSF
jgi:hypothetical protein